MEKLQRICLVLWLGVFFWGKLFFNNLFFEVPYNRMLYFMFSCNFQISDEN